MSAPLLKDLRCPHCGRAESFQVDVLATVQITQGDTTLVGDYFGDGDFSCCCLSCDHIDRVFRFQRRGSRP